MIHKIVYVLFLICFAFSIEIFTRYWLDKPIMDSKIGYYKSHPFFNYILNEKHNDHNSLGFRGKFNGKSKIDIICMGGSTTYCVKVAAGKSWPAMLAKKSGLNVLNGGVPAYTTAHHISLLALKLIHLKPRLIIFHIGFNDLKVELLYPNLKSDYSNAFKAWSEPFYYRSQFLSKIIDGSQHIGRIIEHLPQRQFTTGTNNAVAFKSNILTLLAICKQNDIKVMFVIQPTFFQRLHFKKVEMWEKGMNDKANFLLQLSRTWKFKLIDLREKMSDKEEFFQDYIHVNESGAELKAEIINENLSGLLYKKD